MQGSFLCSPQKTESITLADISPVVIARNVLLAHIITSITFDPSNKDDLDYLWDVWYNMEWSSKTLERFLEDVTLLTKTELFSKNVMIPAVKDVDTLKVIWKFWLFSASEMSSDSIKKIRDER